MSVTAPTHLLPIGAFARRSRLSLKALRLYDELGLLPPARVDPETGYRSYVADQVDRARLRLRRRGAWIEANGAQMSAAPREVYFNDDPEPEPDRPFCDVAFPIGSPA